MSTREYMMILSNTDWDEGLSIEDTQRIIGEYNEWVERLSTGGILTGGRPLLAGGRVIARQGERVADGPFIESKEAVGGFIVIKARDYDEAVAIAGSFPPVQVGVRVELREFADLCPVSQRLEKRLAHETQPAGA